MSSGAIPAAIVDRTSRLVDDARHGDRAAFEALLQVRLDDLFRTAWAILGDERDARDATQDACLMAWRRLPTLREPSTPIGFGPDQPHISFLDAIEMP